MGLLDPAVLDQFMGDDTLLAGHPVRQKLPELVEINSGGLGHGLPIAVGLALGNKLAGRAHRRAFVLLGDGELAEGSNWEAAMAASKFKLDNLIAIVDRNRLQLAGKTEAIMPLEPLAEKWRAFGFETLECDGHDPAALVAAIQRPSQDKPRVILANTERGTACRLWLTLPPGITRYRTNNSWRRRWRNWRGEHAGFTRCRGDGVDRRAAGGGRSERDGGGLHVHVENRAL